MDINKIVEILKNGGLAIIPNDTVYGIICDALNIDSINKIYELKNRDYSKPMLILVSNKKMLKKCCKSINKLEEELINNYLPGELTIILDKSDYINDLVTSNFPTVGIRIPNNKELIEIIDKLGNPIVSTSANISGSININSIDLLDEKIKNNVDYIYDKGIINSLPSTIVRVENNSVKIIREGYLSQDIKNRFNI